MSPPRKYPEELKERSVRLVFESDRPMTEIARDLGINYESLRQWVRQAEADGGKAAGKLTSSERERLKDLEREVKDLRKSNEILRAASVFFAKELDPPRTR